MSAAERIKQLKTKANKLPLLPGVYIMKNKHNAVIYVGKAKALKNRVTQYFGNHSNHTAKVIKMVENVFDFDTIICDSEYEALVLENSLIKMHQPKYNILLKDDKGYHYIKITADKWPKIEAVNSKENDGAQYIGPYYSGFIVKQTVDEALKIYKLPNCNRSFDKPSKPCLNYHIGLCYAPCKNKQSLSDYKETVDSAINYIKNGGIDDTEVSRLKIKMNSAAEKLDFEYAAKLRDRISAIEKFKEKQKVILSGNKREDYFAVASVGETAAVSVLIFKNGHLSDKKIFLIDGFNKKEYCYSEFLQRYYSDSQDIPPIISIDCDFADKPLITEWLSNIRGGKVTISVPQKGVRKQILNMCLSNATQELSNKIERNGKETSAINELAELLGLSSAPHRIESYDISNTAGSENVGAMVVCIDGRMTKSLYRKFKIKTFSGQDDYRSLNEVLDRRFSEYIRGEDESFKELPDLILLDGGKGQLSAVRPVFEKYSLKIPVFGMVKDSKHKTRAITAGGEDIQIKANRKTFTFITSIQDEVHRFAITYHKQRKSSSTLKLELMNISGVGEKTAIKLIKQFKTIKAIKNANLSDFKTLGFSEKLAQRIIDYYKE